MPLSARIALGMLFLAAGLSGCDSIFNNQPPPSTPATQPTSNSGSYTTLEQSVHEQINQYRKSQNLPPLTLNAEISKEAKAHSQAMANGTVAFSHDGFEGRVKEIGKSINYRSAAENVAYNQGYSDPATQAVQGWIKSPGHLKNIQGDFNLTGIGIVQNAKGEYYLTQIFIKRG